MRPGRIPRSLLRTHRAPLRQPTGLLSIQRAIFKPLRYASTVTEARTDTASLVTRLKNLLYGTSIALFLTFTYLYVTDTRAGIHQWVVVPSLSWFYADAEEAHEAGTKALKVLHSFGLHPRERGDPDVAGDLSVSMFGHTLHNPIATSAGIDKHAEIPTPLLALGPAIVELGGATPFPQDGNPQPRVFRIPSQNALINRYGLNSEGAETMAMRLRQRVREFAYAMGLGLDEEAERMVLDGEAGVPPGSLTEGKLLAVQVAKNKVTPEQDIEAVKRDYVYCVEQLARYADIIVVNVSSPNTPGLRTLQRVEPLTNILKGVVAAARAVDRKTKPAVMVKVSPDEDSDEQVAGICAAVWDSGVDGVIVGNTTKKRPDAIPQGYVLPARETALLLEQGGYSGPQMFERTLALVKRYRRLLDQGSGRSSVEQEKLPHITAAPLEPEDAGLRKIEESVRRDAERLKNPASEDDVSENQPLFQLPERHTAPSELSDDLTNSGPALSASHHLEQSRHTPQDTPRAEPDTAVSRELSTLSSPAPLKGSEQPKVIFATGGITNGKQALEILQAGASVAMVYTALVYGGVGTISRIKAEMREEIGKGKKL